MKNSFLISLFMVLGLFAYSGGVLAQTADGVTPAEETVCGGLEGPLKGLCIAYCEAMDCDSEFTMANPMACEKVAANWAKKTSDPLPCEKPFDACTAPDCNLGGGECPTGTECVQDVCFTCGPLGCNDLNVFVCKPI